ncbi:MAG: multidrug effflux MFS transporter [Hyphomonadaceae bacterium]
MLEAPPQQAPRTLAIWELVGLVAALSALNALAIDIMLPALPDIARAYNLAQANDRQLVVVAYVALFGVAQLVYGPLADAFGRKSVLIWAQAIFCIGSVLCVVAPSFELLLAARALQGVGAAATRVIATAVVRDLMEGRRMAQVMSMAMTVFMIVPIVAPGLGQLILFVAPWRWIFAALLIYALAVAAWTWLRLPETLRPENRTPFEAPAIARAYATAFRDRQMLGYMIATTFVTGALFGYVTSSEQVYVDVYALGPAFSLAFASVAIGISVGTSINARIVMRLGMRRISQVAIIALTCTAAVHAVLQWLGLVSFWPFLLMMMVTMGCFGMVAGNLNALAMEKMGHVAGSASALFGAVTASFGAILGGLIARGFDGTAFPLVAGIALMGALTLGAIVWVERGRLFRDGARP